MGNYYGLAIDEDGKLWGWGYNYYGGTGNGDTTGASTSFIKEVRQVGDNASKWVTVTAGFYHSMGLREDGSIWTWGTNGNYATGLGTNAGHTLTATEVPTKKGDWKYISQISSWNYNAFAIDKNGNLYAWGVNVYGNTGLGIAHGSFAQTPTRVGSGTGYRFVSGGTEHSLAVKTDGTLWAWGLQDNGKLGNGKTSSWIGAPERIGTDNDWVYAQAGRYSSIGIKANGTIWFWGYGGPLTNTGALGAISSPTQQELQ